jgi:hypothetical protein
VIQFRQKALASRREADRLDAEMRVARPRAWLGVAEVGLLLVALLVWAFLGNLPQTVDASGVIAGRNGVTQIQSTQTGEVTRILAPSKTVVGPQTPVLELTDAQGRTSIVRPHLGGRVGAIDAHPGQVVTVGRPLFTLEPVRSKGEPLFAYLFLEPKEAAEVEPGMQATITTLNNDQISGRVDAVADAPASRAELVASGGSDLLVNKLAAQSPVVVARVTPTQPLPKSLRNGSLIAAAVTVHTRRPIDVVFGS